MSRATISTGSITIDKKASQQSSPAGDGCSIVLLADFSGRDHRKHNDAQTIRQRKILQIDRDNFDEIFARLNVQCDLPLADEPLDFGEMDDMHPDFIFRHVSIFEQFQQLQRQLENSSTFAAASEIIDQWSSVDHMTSSASTASDEGKDYQPGSLLDDILSADGPSRSAGSFDVQALIQDIVGPYISPKPDPKQQDYIDAVAQASSKLMRNVMHHHQFQTIESAWRSLYLLVRRIETDEKLKLFIVDVSLQELVDDAAASGSYENSGIYKLLFENRQAAGTAAFNVIMADAIFGRSAADLAALGNLGETARAMSGLFVAGGSEQLAACESLVLTPDRDDWNFSLPTDIADSWRQLRATQQARHIVLVAPRYLARMPYGAKTSPIESFEFEELGTNDKHPYYLWSCGAWLVVLQLAQNYSLTGSLFDGQVQEIGGLALHVYVEDDEEVVTPCAEINMLDSAARALREAGLSPIRSIVAKDSVCISELEAISLSGRSILR